MRNDLVERKIKSCRTSTKKNLEFKKKLGLDSDVDTCDEWTSQAHFMLHLKEK